MAHVLSVKGVTEGRCVPEADRDCGRFGAPLQGPPLTGAALRARVVTRQPLAALTVAKGASTHQGLACPVWAPKRMQFLLRQSSRGCSQRTHGDAHTSDALPRIRGWSWRMPSPRPTLEQAYLSRNKARPGGLSESARTGTWHGHLAGSQLARLRTVAISVLNSHVSNRGRCTACGSDWPCRRAVLAQHNLALCNDTGVLRPPETVSRRQRFRPPSIRNGWVSRQRAFWPVTQPSPTSHGALGGDMTMQWPLQNSLQLGALPTAAPCARLHAKHLLWEWGLETITDTAELLVSELVTNGVKAVQAMGSKPPVWLRLSTNSIQLPSRSGMEIRGRPAPEN